MVVVSISAAAIRRRLSFAVTALGALVVGGLSVTAMALIGSYPAALVLWAASSGFGLLLNINTSSLRQAIVPSHLYGRVVSVAMVLAWSAIPLGALVGAAAIQLSGSVGRVYAVTGALTAVIALRSASARSGTVTGTWPRPQPALPVRANPRKRRSDPVGTASIRIVLTVATVRRTSVQESSPS